MWRFRIGPDWGTDPTGNTLLPNIVLVDGLLGDDANDGLSISSPLKSVTQAKALYPNTYTIVCAPWRYVDQLGTVGGSGETYVIVGDSEDQDVVFIDSQGNRNGFAVSGFENLTLINYLNANPGNQRAAINCTFVDCANVRFNFLYGCRIINSPLVKNFNANGNISSCALLNCAVTISNTSSTFGISFRGCYIDENSTLNLINGPSNLIGCHVVNETNWTDPNMTASGGTTFGDDFIFDKGLLNFSFDPLQSPLFGRGFPDGFSNPRHMARYYVGSGFYSGLPSFDAKVAANSNLAVVGNELLNIGPNNVEFIETDVVTLDSLQALGVPHKVGILSYLSTLFGLNPAVDNLDRVLEIRYADTDAASLGAYSKYRFGEQATNNTGGIGNGEDTYSWANNNLVFVKKFQARIGVVKQGVVI